MTRPTARPPGLQNGGLTRRLFLGAGATALGLTVTACSPGAAARTAHVRLQLTLFPPTGAYPIGTMPLHLVDRSRRDPWVPTRPRELMVSVWYPALSIGHYARAPWMPKAAGALFLKQLIPSPPTSTGTTATPTSVSLQGVSLPVTRARQGAPVDLSAQRYPVVLYQPGYGDDRELGTGLVSDLASRGYVVVTMDDTYEAAEVEFPNGHVAVPAGRPSADVSAVRIADTRFVLGELAALESGVNPDAEQRPLPAGLTKALDLTKVGMFGHSLGGATAAKAMAADARIGAGIDLDGSLFLVNPSLPSAEVKKLSGAVAEQIGDRPFMMMSSHGFGPQDDPSWAGFWPKLRGWRLFLTMRHSEHYTCTDLEEFLSQLLAAGIIPRRLASQLVTATIGTVNPAQAVAADRAYIGAFFDLHLRDRASNLLNHPSPRFPDIQFLGT
jgi:hypothetical protein